MSHPHQSQEANATSVAKERNVVTVRHDYQVQSWPT